MIKIIIFLISLVLGYVAVNYFSAYLMSVKDLPNAILPLIINIFSNTYSWIAIVAVLIAIILFHKKIKEFVFIVVLGLLLGGFGQPLLNLIGK